MAIVLLEVQEVQVEVVAVKTMPLLDPLLQGKDLQEVLLVVLDQAAVAEAE